jgi:hypothetical protein
MRVQISKNIKHVVEAVRSPKSAKRWHVKMSCGHDGWVMSEAKPTRAICLVKDCAPLPKKSSSKHCDNCDE